MITFKINDKSIAIPTTWEEVTYLQFQGIFNLKEDSISVVALFTGMDYEYLKSAEIPNVDGQINGVERMLIALSFMNTATEFPTYVSECGPYKIPGNTKGQFNIQYESLGQFEDARQVMNKTENTPAGLTKAYGKFVSIYLQKIRDGKYDPLKVPEVEEEIKSFPAYQVISLGQFFFVKLKILLSGTQTTSPDTPQNQKKKDSNGSSRSSAVMPKSIE